MEVPYFKIPTINIGDRQKGRVTPLSVLHSACDKEEMVTALKKAFKTSFLKKIECRENKFMVTEILRKR